MRACVTTSWDDGGAFDLKIAEMLREREMAGTFYWTVDFEPRPLPNASDREEIVDLGMEVGSHTMTHPDLTALDDEALRWELAESKTRLADLTGSEVTSFCYPSGYFNRRVANAVAAAGYRLGRTTVGFRKDLGSDPFHVPVSIQIFPHGRRVHLSHGVKQGNVIGLMRWLTSHRAGTDLRGLVSRALTDITGNGGVLHLWGHGWELEENDLWDSLEGILDAVAGHSDVDYVTNRDLLGEGERG